MDHEIYLVYMKRVWSVERNFFSSFFQFKFLPVGHCRTLTLTLPRTPVDLHMNQSCRAVLLLLLLAGLALRAILAQAADELTVVNRPRSKRVIIVDSTLQQHWLAHPAGSVHKHGNRLLSHKKRNS